MASFDLIIRNGSVVLPDRVERADVAIADEKFAEIAPEIAGAAREEIDATGLHLFPGVIDPHVHFNEPGRTEWEGFATGSSALAAGGGTLFFDMPLNSSPPVLDGESFDLKLAAAREKSFTDFALWGGLTPKNLDRMEELAARGVVGFKAFMCNSGIDDFERADDLTLYRGMQIAARLGLVVAVHAENEEITSRLANEARAARRSDMNAFLESRPVVAEVEAINRAIAFAHDTGCKLHIVHVSSAAGAWRVARGRRTLGDPIRVDLSAETCPHYLLLSDADLELIGARAKCAPPLRSARDLEAFRQAVLDGKRLDFIASDHSPSPPQMKSSDNYLDVWGGIAGVQSTLSIMLTIGRQLTASRIAALTASNAAARFCIARKGRITTGFDADLAIVDANAAFELKREHLLDRHKLSPYVGRTFHGVVRRTILRGHTIFTDGKIVGPPRGKFVRPAL